MHIYYISRIETSTSALCPYLKLSVGVDMVLEAVVLAQLGLADDVIELHQLTGYQIRL